VNVGLFKEKLDDITSRLFPTVAALVALVCSVTAAQTLGRPERFTANAVSLSPQYGTGQQTVEITVDRWSLASDRERLVMALQQKGPDELLKQLQKMKPVGESERLTRSATIFVMRSRCRCPKADEAS
jgi:hypothetical protein